MKTWIHRAALGLLALGALTSIDAEARPCTTTTVTWSAPLVAPPRPPVQVVVRPAPVSPHQVWVDGQWEWVAGAWIWRPGAWVTVAPPVSWAPARPQVTYRPAPPPHRVAYAPQRPAPQRVVYTRR